MYYKCKYLSSFDTIFFDRFFFFSVENFWGNEEILILILWRRVVCTVKYSFGRSDFSGGAKVAQEGKKNREKSLKEGFR